jgi:hypothetical protein
MHQRTCRGCPLSRYSSWVPYRMKPNHAGYLLCTPIKSPISPRASALGPVNFQRFVFSRVISRHSRDSTSFSGSRGLCQAVCSPAVVSRGSLPAACHPLFLVAEVYTWRNELQPTFQRLSEADRDWAVHPRDTDQKS